MGITASRFKLRANVPEGRKAISYQLLFGALIFLPLCGLLAEPHAVTTSATSAGDEVTGARAIARATTILFKPLRTQNKLDLPVAPAGYRWRIVSTKPAGIIEPDGALRRPSKDTDVAVTLRVSSEAYPEDVADVTLTVPIDCPYVAPTTTEAGVKAGRGRYERQKYGLFVHYVPGRTPPRHRRVGSAL
jgi:hypothetical protein